MARAPRHQWSDAEQQLAKRIISTGNKYNSGEEVRALLTLGFLHYNQYLEFDHNSNATPDQVRAWLASRSPEQMKELEAAAEVRFRSAVDGARAQSIADKVVHELHQPRNLVKDFIFHILGVVVGIIASFILLSMFDLAGIRSKESEWQAGMVRDLDGIKTALKKLDAQPFSKP